MLMDFYQTDIGKQYYRYPFRAFFIGDPLEDNLSLNPIDLIPQSILNLLFLNETQPICPTTGISPRWLEVFDTRKNAYRIDVPIPWIQLPNLSAELSSDNRVFGWLGHGEIIKGWNLN